MRPAIVKTTRLEKKVKKSSKHLQPKFTFFFWKKKHNNKNKIASTKIKYTKWVPQNEDIETCQYLESTSVFKTERQIQT